MEFRKALTGRLFKIFVIITDELLLMVYDDLRCVQLYDHYLALSLK